MATLGSPPAGWYTDPSGQHRARYWDGGNWTEQVRDDVAAPSAVAGEQTHEVAATVAGIALALATVAEQDVAEPVFVVDYGTADPTPHGVTETSVDGGVAAMAGSSAVDSAPIPGWYPDPSMRHQARFWDGFKWTERVADQGTEGVDPIPGTAAVKTADFGMAASDPPDGWSAQLPGGTEVDTAFPQVVAGESMVSAGQASLAMLPEREDVEDHDDEQRVRMRPTGKVVVGAWMVVFGAVALLLGSTMPWMQVRGPRVSDTATATGMNLGDGRVTVALAILLAVLAVGILTGRMQRFGGTKVAGMGVLVAGAAAVAVTAVDIADVADRSARLGVPAGAVTSVGSGLWLCFLGGLLAVAGGVMAFANRERSARL